MNKFLFLFITVSLFGVSLKSFGQKVSVKKEFNRDSSQMISKKGFDSLVDQSITLFENKTLEDISDEEHIEIMLCLNTIFMRDFENGRYEKLELVVSKKEYIKNITKRYPEWIPNRGMGFYFPKLQMELYGTPSPYAIFDVIE